MQENIFESWMEAYREMTIIFHNYSWQVKNSALYITHSINVKSQWEEKDMPLFWDKNDEMRRFSESIDDLITVKHNWVWTIPSLSLKKTGPNVQMSHVKLKPMLLLAVFLWSPKLLGLAEDTKLFCLPSYSSAHGGFLLLGALHTVSIPSKLSIQSLILKANPWQSYKTNPVAKTWIFLAFSGTLLCSSYEFPYPRLGE